MSQRLDNSLNLFDIPKQHTEYKSIKSKIERSNTMPQGFLTVYVSTAENSIPIENARVYIKTSTSGSSLQGEVSQNNYNYILTTNSTGLTPTVRIDTPDSSSSLNENSDAVPYALADVLIDKSGYFPIRVKNVQVYSGNQSHLPVNLLPVNPDYNNVSGGVINYTVPPNQLIISSDRVPEGPAENTVTPFVTDRIYIPERVRVHIGPPSSTGEIISVPFTEYIKNVASSEIYPTWPENSLRANIHAIVSLTLNRIFTEWYPSQGYNFDITSSTGYDQAFVPGRNIFDNISRIVDEVFNVYVVRDDSISPLFTQFCDGKRVNCAGLSQWGTVTLAEQGYTPLQILRYYYGDEIELESTDDIMGLESSYPGEPLQLGDRGDDVLALQRRLARIRQNYPAISAIPTIDGVFSSSTDAAVRDFQEIFDLAVDGIVGRSTWNRISYIYSAVTRLAELNSESLPDFFLGEVPDTTIQQGDEGNEVLLLQLLLNFISNFYPTVPNVSRDSLFGSATAAAVRAFQQTFGLSQTGIVNETVWDALFQVVLYIIKTIAIDLPEQGFPGADLTLGDRNDAVRLMQIYLGVLSGQYPSIGQVAADGVFGPATQRAVLAFQREFLIPQTGIIDAATWERIVEAYNFLTATQ